MSFKSFREESRANCGTDFEKLTLEQVNTGALLRIADAVEKMAADYIQLQNKLKLVNEDREYLKNKINKLNKLNAGLKGVITKLKKRL